MHTTAMQLGKLFFDTYAKPLPSATVVDIGAQDVNGSLKSVCPSNCKYIGVDFVEGKGVDVILQDPYKLPFDDHSIDIIVSSSCFEHSEFFWLSFVEMMRILRPGGLCYINAPSNGLFHQYPVDCWRFYPDSARALAGWARRNDLDVMALESFINRQSGTTTDAIWNDAVMVFLKGSEHRARFPDRMLNHKQDFFNGYVDNEPTPRNFQPRSEDMLQAILLKQKISSFLEDLQVMNRAAPATTDERFAKLATSVNKFIASLQVISK